MRTLSIVCLLIAFVLSPLSWAADSSTSTAVEANTSTANSSTTNTSKGKDDTKPVPKAVAKKTAAQDKYEGIERTVNINKATAAEIATMLQGIGEKKAQQIVDYREANGPYKAVSDLLNVKGIGKATLEKNSDRILL